MKNRKPLWIALGALAGVFLIAAVIALIAGLAGRGGKGGSSAEDAPYPYSWEEKGGVITLTLTSEGLKDGSWSQASGTIVEVNAGKPGNSRTVMTISPVEPGREEIAFLLSDSSGAVAEAAFTVEVVRSEDGSLSAAVSDHQERALQSTLTGGADGRYPFTVTSENGALLLKIADPALADAFAETDEAQDEAGGSEGESPSEDGQPPVSAADGWQTATTDSLVARPVMVGYGQDGITYRIESGADGDADVTVYNADAGVYYVFSLVSRRGSLSISGHREAESLPAPTREDLDETISGMSDIVSGLQPYTPPPEPEDQEGEQDDGLGEMETENG